MAALLCRVYARVIRPHCRRYDTLSLQLGEIQKIEGRNTRSHAVGCHARQLAAGESELYEIQLLQNPIREPCVRACVERERRQIMFVVVGNLTDTVTDVAGDRL